MWHTLPPSRDFRIIIIPSKAFHIFLLYDDSGVGANCMTGAAFLAACCVIYSVVSSMLIQSAIL